MKTRENEASSQKNRKFRNDGILAAVIVIIAVAVLLLINLTKVEGNSVVVKIDGVETQRFSLEENIEFEIKTGKNDENYNVLVIEDRKARIVDADCPDGICEESGPVFNVGETIICLPHKVVIEIVGDNTDMELDAAI